MSRAVFYVSNALDDATRLQRGIQTDSPAASRKVFLVCEAARRAGIRAVVVSLGRGRGTGRLRFWPTSVRRVGGVPVIYLSFVSLGLVSQVLSLVALAPVLWRIRHKYREATVLFYNRAWLYLAGLVTARLARYRIVLDLEDGATELHEHSLAGVQARALRALFDSQCSGGALLACDALRTSTALRPTECCYGVSVATPTTARWALPDVTVLLGGTVGQSTGAPLLLEGIRTLRKESPWWARRVRVEVTGKGDCLDAFRELAVDAGSPTVVVHGRISDADYDRVLRRTQVGLALKSTAGPLANTTFPSKVIELASHGILVVSTDISDVRRVLGGGALYLTSDDPRHLMQHLRWIVENRQAASEIAADGATVVLEICSPIRVGRMLDRFLFVHADGSRQ
jgi:hypothetical protein